jgi:hypothetical protein
MHSHWSWRQVRLGLGLFAAAAPAVAMLGYFVVGSVPVFASPVGVALCLVLSGGTFIYAACLHILPEALSVADKGAHSHRVSRQQVTAIAMGAVLPLVFSLGHSHSHGGGEHHHHHHHEHGLMETEQMHQLQASVLTMVAEAAAPSVHHHHR